MNDTPIWQKSKAERAEAFATAFANTVPEERKTPPLSQQLNAVRPLIIQRRQQGFSVEQICTGLQHPTIGIVASTASIRRLLRDADRRRDQKRKAKAAALMAGIAPATPKSATSVACGSTATKRA